MMTQKFRRTVYSCALPFPGKPAGFSWVRSRKLPFNPVAIETLDSPNLSRRRSAADRALLPALTASAFQQIFLLRFAFKRRRMNSQQAHLRSFTPVLAKQSAHLFENFGVELCGSGQAMSAGDGGEIFVAEFELDGARVQLMFAQPAAHHLGKPHQGGFDLLGIGGVFVVGVFVADGFGIGIGADFAIKPSTSIFAARFAGQRQPPFAKMFFEKSIVKAARSPTCRMPKRMQILLRDFANAGDIAHIQRREKFGFLSGNDPQNSVRFGLGRGNFRNQARAANSDRAIQLRFRLSSV